MIKNILNSTNALFVFALKTEAQNCFNEVDTLFTGVGKVNAAYHLTKKIEQKRPDIIINLGSAGSNTFERGEVVCCTKFIQRDMDASMIGCEPYETPFSEVPPILEYGIEIDNLSLGICGTGDSFEVNHITDRYNVVDMEAYSLAYIAQQEKIPFLCLKYISDGADDKAHIEWETTVKNAAEALKNVIEKLTR